MHLIREIGHFLHLPHLAGAHFDYSNPGYVCLGEIISRASGDPMQQYARQKIAELSAKADANDPIAAEAALEPWLGVIDALAGRRWWNLRSPSEYIRRIEAGDLSIRGRAHYPEDLATARRLLRAAGGAAAGRGLAHRAPPVRARRAGRAGAACAEGLARAARHQPALLPYRVAAPPGAERDQSGSALPADQLGRAACLERRSESSGRPP